MNEPSPCDLGFFQPAEWVKHSAVWLAWPYDFALWENHLEPTRAAFLKFCEAILGRESDGYDKAEILKILVPNEAEKSLASLYLKSLLPRIKFFVIPFGDIWLRDTAPIFLCRSDLQKAKVRFRFNGWGGKYVLKNDAEVGEAIAGASLGTSFSMPFIFEGGSLESNGMGTALTTRECLLNPNRNPQMTAADWESLLGESLGVRKLIWLERGLKNDHTDGHIDNLARFVNETTVVCQEARDASDPNAEVYREIRAGLESSTDASGHPLQVVSIPSPGKIVDADEKILPASYMNFFIANRSVVVPTFDSIFDSEAMAGLQKLFTDRRVVGINSCSLLSGGGSFHCISQQEPEGAYE